MLEKEKKPYTTAIILGGGSGRRMNTSITKQRMTLGGMSVLKRSVLAFEKCGDITDIIVVVRSDEVEFFNSELKDVTKLKAVCTGGDSRPESAGHGFMLVDKECKYVAIHDAARPLIRPEDISRVLNVAKEKGAAIAASPVYDTVKAVDGEGKVTATPKRQALVRATTPQIFEYGIYRQAINSDMDLSDITDDSMMVERLGKEVYAVVLENENPKITTKDDISVLELLLNGEK